MPRNTWRRTTGIFPIFASASALTERWSGTIPVSTPLSGLFDTAYHGTLAYFSQIGPLSYLIATVLFGLGLLVGSWITVGHPVLVAEHSARPAPEKSPPMAEPLLVGRITGMADCHWVNRETARLQQSR